MTRPWKRPHRLSPDVYARPEFVFAFTICSAQGEPHFRVQAIAEEVISSLMWARQTYGWLLFAYCLMPDHLHIVFRNPRPEQAQINAGRRGRVPVSVPDHIARFKSFTTKKFHDLGHRGNLWQHSSYDTVYDNESRIVDVIRYVLENPVRAGLVDYVDDWPYAKIVDRIDVQHLANSREIRCHDPRNLYL